MLRRALRALPAGVGQVKLRAGCGYFAADLTLAAYREGVEFAVGANRITTIWQALAGLGESDWTDATDMPGAQVAVAHYPPATTVPNHPQPATRGGTRAISCAQPLTQPQKITNQNRRSLHAVTRGIGSESPGVRIPSDIFLRIRAVVRLAVAR
ncbi:MAG: hypothetical protein LC808_03505 [Actinobacteria bacterium]|nr:hypothetical protein [Actinomycetota bacterium]